MIKTLYTHSYTHTHTHTHTHKIGDCDVSSDQDIDWFWCRRDSNPDLLCEDKNLYQLS